MWQAKCTTILSRDDEALATAAPSLIPERECVASSWQQGFERASVWRWGNSRLSSFPVCMNCIAAVIYDCRSLSTHIRHSFKLQKPRRMTTSRAQKKKKTKIHTIRRNDCIWCSIVGVGGVYERKWLIVFWVFDVFFLCCHPSLHTDFPFAQSGRFSTQIPATSVIYQKMFVFYFVWIVATSLHCILWQIESRNHFYWCFVSPVQCALCTADKWSCARQRRRRQLEIFSKTNYTKDKSSEKKAKKNKEE